jgi:hypothetical protein
LANQIKTGIDHVINVLKLLLSCSFNDLYFALTFYIWFAALGALLGALAASVLSGFGLVLSGVIANVIIQSFIVGWWTTKIVERCESGRSN